MSRRPGAFSTGCGQLSHQRHTLCAVLLSDKAPACPVRRDEDGQCAIAGKTGCPSPHPSPDRSPGRGPAVRLSRARWRRLPVTPSPRRAGRYRTHAAGARRCRQRPGRPRQSRERECRERECRERERRQRECRPRRNWPRDWLQLAYPGQPAGCAGRRMSPRGRVATGPSARIRNPAVARQVASAGLSTAMTLSQWGPVARYFQIPTARRPRQCRGWLGDLPQNGARQEHRRATTLCCASAGERAEV